MNEIKLPPKGAVVELYIESLAFGGMGIAHLHEMVVFVKHAIPGQTVQARILKKRRSYLEALRLDIISESPHAVKLRCDHFEYCGGCTFQNLNYREQLSAKEGQVRDVFKRIGGFDDLRVESIFPCEEIYHYRNKMEFTFSNRRWILPDEDEKVQSNFALGLHIPGRYDKILNIDACALQDPVADELLQFVKSKVQERALQPYDIKTHTGFLRNLVIRSAAGTGEIMVNLVTAYEETQELKALAAEIAAAFPRVVSIVNNITGRKSGVAKGEYEITLQGQDYITETLGEFRFQISANSFFQTNSRQARRLYDLAEQLCEFTGEDIVYDLYCGTGSIGIYFSESVRKVYGFELEPSAIRDARRNARLNKVDKMEFFEGDLMDLLSKTNLKKSLETPDVLILDPPRAGLHPHTVRDILKLNPRRILYISCNPSTQARDASLLCRESYALLKIQPVDMFPHTPHVENIALLTRKK
ncbi:MAG: 23S rRNA (uracil(1939)-C(5))-methyltransferase RlmD [FCB group bacterium]|nr:23S rRNA (uracil(1939)-C(5))-methyltransferase RlmD [FCB group bacterium]